MLAPSKNFKGLEESASGYNLKAFETHRESKVLSFNISAMCFLQNPRLIYACIERLTALAGTSKAFNAESLPEIKSTC